MFPQVETPPAVPADQVRHASMKDALNLVRRGLVVRHGFQIFRYFVDGKPAKLHTANVLASAGLGDLVRWVSIEGEYELHVRAELTDAGRKFLSTRKARK